MRKLLVLLTLVVGSSVAKAEDPGWPRIHTIDQGQVTVFQPQIEGWDDFKTIHFRFAMAVVPTGRKAPVYGSVLGTASTEVDWQNRTVFISKAAYPEIRFPGASETDAAVCTAIARGVADPNQTWELSLDRVIAGVQAGKSRQRPVEVSLEPPPIFHADREALLVVFMGPPTWQVISGTSLQFATNTNWPVVKDPQGGRVYLLDGESWLTAPDALAGPWTAATALPPDLYRLPDDGNWTRVKANVPGHLPAVLPVVFASDRPAELLVTKGEPQLVVIPGTQLLYVSNTSSDLFLDVAKGSYYLLAAGRWFSAPGLTGPWSAATKDLPPDFAKIPADSPKADVLASVPGTPQAEEAVLLASIPRSATVDRATTTIAVTYQGAPHFVPVDGAQGVTVADNSADVVFQVGAAFYCCRDGIWFQAPQAAGPWAVCSEVPAAIYTIPATSPYHGVTYVTVYQSTPTSVTVGYTGGYTGAYVVGGLVMFGAGYWLGAAAATAWASPYAAWHYPASWYAYGTAAHYDYYAGGYVRGASAYGPYGGAGYAARYNPSTGTYSRGAAAYGPYAGAGAAAAYNPSTGAYARGAAAYGPNGAAAAAGGYDPSTGRGAATVQHQNAYGSWGQSVVTAGNESARTAHASSAWGSTAGYQTSTGGAGVVHQGATGNTGAVQTSSGAVYAGHDGNVYRYSPTSSSWQKNTGSGWEDPGWQKSSQPATAARSSTSSAEGVQRNLESSASSRSYGNYRSEGASERSSGGRSGGGGRSRR